MFDTELNDFGQNSSSLRVEPLEASESVAIDGWSNKSTGFTFTVEGILCCEMLFSSSLYAAPLYEYSFEGAREEVLPPALLDRPS